MTGVLSLLHKGGPLADQPSHFRPVVLLNTMNQLVAYVVNERRIELVEHGNILSQARPRWLPSGQEYRHQYVQTV